MNSDMIDPRTLELLNGELDGELTPAERQELETRLAGDPAARLMRAQWRQMDQALAAMPAVEPPAGLSQRWQPAAPKAAPVSPERRRRRQWLGRGMAMAAGTLLFAFAVGLSGLGRPGLQHEALVGTIMPLPVAAGRSVAVAQPGLQGTISLAPGERGWDLVFDLEASAPVAVSASYDVSVLRLDGYAGGDAGTVPFNATPGRIVFQQQGAQHLALHLQPGKGGQIRVRLEGGWGAAQEIVFDLPASE